MDRQKRIPGFGHRIHTADPRTKRLFELAERTQHHWSNLSLFHGNQVAQKSQGKKLPINVDGAIAAIISDMGFDWRLGKAFFLLGRVGVNRSCLRRADPGKTDA